MKPSSRQPGGHWVSQLRALIEESDADRIIDLSVGQPDGPAPAAVERVLRGEPLDHLHHYPEAAGSSALRTAISGWLERRIGISFGPDEVVVTHGAKLAVALVSHAFSEPGGTIAVPTPGYPTYSASARQGGRHIRWLELLPEHGFLPTRPQLVGAFRDAQMAYLAFPSNPTGVAASPEVFRQAVEVAQETGTIVVHDAAYLELAHDGGRHSIFEVPGARDVAIELYSFSKSFNLAGFRVAFAVGARPLLDRFKTVMARNDSGASRLSQAVALAVIAEAPDFADRRLERDRRRTEAMARGLGRLGCRLVPPSAAFYVWLRPPPGRESLGFQAVVRRAGIAAAPGEAFGPSGAGWLRFACVQPSSVYPEVLERLGRLWGQ